MAIDVDPVAIGGIWWRHLPHKAKVYYRPEHPADGRWNRGSAVEAWYFADTPETVWAEWYRVLAEQHLRPEVLLPRDLWRWAVDLPRVADLGTSARLARVGLGLPPPQRNSWPAYQDVGYALFQDGWEALVAPSAARPDGKILCVFRTTVREPGVRPVPPPRVHRRPPVPPAGMQI